VAFPGQLGADFRENALEAPAKYLGVVGDEVSGHRAAIADAEFRCVDNAAAE